MNTYRLSAMLVGDHLLPIDVVVRSAAAPGALALARFIGGLRVDTPEAAADEIFQKFGGDVVVTARVQGIEVTAERGVAA
jgi:hypothetical protein